MRFLSHLELLNLFVRAVGRARIPIRFSQGFHPHPKFSFATALSVGVESWAEYMDMEISAGYGADRVKEQLNRVLPGSMEIMEAHEIPLRADSLSAIIEAVRYRVTLPTPGLDLQHLAGRFLALDSFPYRREKRGKVLDLDLRHELVDLKVDGNCLEMVIRKGKPQEFALAVTGARAGRADGLADRKTRCHIPIIISYLVFGFQFDFDTLTGWPSRMAGTTPLQTGRRPTQMSD